MQILTGRAGCGDYLTSVACGDTESGNVNLVTFAPANDGSGLQIWNVVAPTPPAPVTQILANGNYYIARCESCTAPSSLAPFRVAGHA